MSSGGNYDMHLNKRKSDVSERVLITQTNACMHGIPHPPSGGASVDEYECVQNDIVFCGCAISLLLNFLAPAYFNH